MPKVCCRGNKGRICVLDFLQLLLPNDSIEDCLDEFENIASYKAWPRSRWVELVQPLLTEEYREVYMFITEMIMTTTKQQSSLENAGKILKRRSYSENVFWKSVCSDHWQQETRWPAMLPCNQTGALACESTTKKDDALN